MEHQGQLSESLRQQLTDAYLLTPLSSTSSFFSSIQRYTSTIIQIHFNNSIMPEDIPKEQLAAVAEDKSGVKIKTIPVVQSKDLEPGKYSHDDAQIAWLNL